MKPFADRVSTADDISTVIEIVNDTLDNVRGIKIQMIIIENAHIIKTTCSKGNFLQFLGIQTRKIRSQYLVLDMTTWKENLM